MKRSTPNRKPKAGKGWSVVTDIPAPGSAHPRATAPAGPPVARLRLEKRRGKPVTVAALEGIPDAELRALHRELKARCGTGGTVKDAELEFQGDHRQTLRDDLAERGVRVKG